MAAQLPDLNRDQTIVGDLRNFQRLREVVNPSQDEVRLHAAAVRRLLLDGVLPAAAGSRALKLAFTVPDAMPLLRAARNKQVALYTLGGMEAFGIFVRNVTIVQSHRPLPEHEPSADVELKLDSFLKQPVAFCAGEILTRYDVIMYVANKAGGVHYDKKASSALPEQKMHALGRLRRTLKIGMENEMPMISMITNPEEEQSGTFRYEPAAIDAVYLEFLATIQFILGSTHVQAVRAAIEADLGWDVRGA